MITNIIAFRLNIHFIHVKPKVLSANTKVLPVLLLHGWPGSVREFYDVIQMLTEKSNEKFAFEVIVPSLPGYGFSQVFSLFIGTSEYINQSFDLF